LENALNVLILTVTNVKQTDLLCVLIVNFLINY
jgi:hypothetical protein